MVHIFSLIDVLPGGQMIYYQKLLLSVRRYGLDNPFHAMFCEAILVFTGFSQTSRLEGQPRDQVPPIATS